ncbi:MAG: GNAT family N-acetyltransferase [Cellulomonadaceae bacterium]|nr:GNAT family N-acetyltransferase [Cellulomonadaceae bacterium]
MDTPRTIPRGAPTEPRLILRPLALTDEDQAWAAHRELAADGFELLPGARDDRPWSAYLDALDRERAGIDLPPGWVPATLLVAAVGDTLVGCLSVRHSLTADLALMGGHIGYGVRPGFRGRGYATQMLRHGLVVLRTLGVSPALVTCADTNLASARVIERCGGRLRDVVPSPHDGRPTRRYDVPVPA